MNVMTQRILRGYAVGARSLVLSSDRFRTTSVAQSGHMRLIGSECRTRNSFYSANKLGHQFCSRACTFDRHGEVEEHIDSRSRSSWRVW